jgi:signal transduction histidine kinase
VRGDAQRLEQVLHHLLDNAIKFSPDGGTVRLSLDREEDQVCVRVEDEGIGLPGDQWERIFDRFYQVDGSLTRRYGGTGVGLALVREVVEAHGGGVWVESEGIPGRGSTFTVFLPAYEGRAVA